MVETPIIHRFYGYRSFHRLNHRFTPNTTEIFYFTSSPVTQQRLSRTRQQRHEVIENLGSLFLFTVNENFSQFASQYLVILLLKLRT